MIPLVMRRAQAFAATLSLVALASCGGEPAKAPTPSLHLSPLTDLAPAAGLSWLVDARPRALAADASLVPAVAMLWSEASLDALTKRYAIDPRQTNELVVAGYAGEPGTTLYLAQALVDPARIERTFAASLLEVEGRAVDHPGDTATTVTRSWGTLALARSRAQEATFGLSGAGLEVGHFGPLRAAEAFATGKLHKAKPALQVDPLDAAATALGDANDPAVLLRAFAPGPFDEATGAALGGLLRAATAVAARARVTHDDADPKKRPQLACRVVLTGAWGAQADDAAARFEAAFHVLATSPTGKLLALDSFAVSPQVSGTKDVLTLDVAYDAETVARALHLATAGSLGELLSSGSASSH